MFQCCTIAKNTIRFSFSHSLTSLFCSTLFFPATYVAPSLPHSLAFTRLTLLASSPLFLIHSFSPTTLHLLLLFHQTPTLFTPLLSLLTFQFIHPDFPLFTSLLISILLACPYRSSIFFTSLFPHSISLSLLYQEVAGFANMGVARRGSQDVFLPDGTGL